MSNLPKKAAPLLAQALSNLLGNPSAGNMVFVQCLSKEIIEDLIQDSRFAIVDWEIALVSAREDLPNRLITADRAVDWRESKGPASLLLIDSTADIPGIDGIKSAAREVSETDLFTEAKKLARDQLPKGTKVFVDKILVQSRKVHRNIAPLCEFRYLCSAAGIEKKEIGVALHEIGLWCVDLEDGKLEQNWLELSGQLVQRFFQGKKLSLEEQIESLYLPPEEEALGRYLAQWLHSVRHFSAFQALPSLEQKFWIHRIHPRFGQNFPNKIEFVSWRAKNQAPLKCSGLVIGAPDGDDKKPSLEWRIDPESEKNSSRLTVKWRVEPKDLQKGAAQYLVTILSGGRSEALSEKTIAHSSTSDQKATFSLGDLSELEKSFEYDAKIEIRVMGQQEVQTESEGFLISSKRVQGQNGGISTLSTPEEVEVGARTSPNLALGVLPSVESWDEFYELSNALSTGSCSKMDKNGCVVFRWKGTMGKVFCPPLLSTLFADWVSRQGMLGRWKQTIRADGSAAGDPEFIPIDVDQKFQNSATEFSRWLEKSHGPVSVLYGDEEVIHKYINDATETFKTCDPIVTLIHTLEVSSLSGRRLGLIVLPTHPLRVAWQQGFDLLVACQHFLEKQLKSTKLKILLEGVRGAYYPFLLPGIDPEECFVFADTLGSHAVALVSVHDAEPKSTVSLLARLFLGKEESAAVHSPLEEVLGEQVKQYLNLHTEYQRILVHALRAGDARIVVRSLGKALLMPEENEETSESQKQLSICYQLNLYPSESRAVELSGQFISDALDRKTVEDSWISDAVERPGGVSLPKLHWAKRNDPAPNTPAHIAIAFDLFRSKVVCQPRSELPTSGVLEAHGLLLMPTREFFPTAEIPYWKSLVSPDPKGEPHPQTAVLTKRQTLLHNAILQATTRHLGGSAEDWPVLVTEVNPRQVIENLHTLCDWVITTDRNGGIEYFDSPHTLPSLYDTHIIDCVPERDDLGFLQLVSSTTRLEEVQSHIGRALDKIGLSNDLYHCNLLLHALKRISGRLALHISDAEDTAQDMIALALVHEYCKNARQGEETWLSLQCGFFVPLDDVPGLLEKKRDDADLLYVHFNERTGFQWTLVEVKFHHYLKTVRSPEVVDTLEKKLNASSEAFEKQYGVGTTVLEKTIRRARLARILRFYARKARRHHLTGETFKRIMQKIDELVFVKKQKVKEIQIVKKVGYIFCPEYQGLQPTNISEDVWMFGGNLLREKETGLATAKYIEIEPLLKPDTQKILPIPQVEVSAPQTVSTPAIQSTMPMETIEIPTQKKVEEPIFQPEPQPQGLPIIPKKATEVPMPQTVPTHQTVSTPPIEKTKLEPPQILLGYTSKEKKVIWRPSIRSNPHLMIVGKPGMGKTNCLINLCLQLNAHGISPIVFSYHSDIDSRIEEHLKDQIKLVKYKDLGFNPMQVPEGSTYLDSLGMLRDLFSAIFPGLGEVQLGRLRSAIKRSYQDLGWSSSERGEIPSFRTFFEILQFEEKPEKNLITRLSELDDYDVFEKQANMASLLEMTSPVFVQIHETQNEVLQRAFSTLTLYNLYQNMFLRGEQKEITHAIIFDEAHKAAKLKLIPRMAKECRKYGIVFVLASQGIKDFDPTLFSAIANYLTLCVDEVDAKLMAKKFVSSQKLKECADLIKKLPKYQGVYHGEGYDFAVTQLLEKVEDI